MIFGLILFALVSAVVVYLLCGLNNKKEGESDNVGCILALVIGALSAIAYFITNS